VLQLLISYKFNFKDSLFIKGTSNIIHHKSISGYPFVNDDLLFPKPKNNSALSERSPDFFIYWKFDYRPVTDGTK